VFHPGFSVNNLCVPTGLILTAFAPLPGYYLFFMGFFLSGAPFSPFSVQAVALMVFQLDRRYPALASGRMVVSYCNLPFDDDMSPSSLLSHCFRFLLFFHQQIHLSALFVI
jgi:hypothetical protein